MDWMEISNQDPARRRMWPIAVMAAVTVLAVAAALAAPMVIPRGARDSVDEQATQQNEAQDSQGGDEQATSTKLVELGGAEALSGLTADQVASLSTAVSRWMEDRGIDPKTPVSVTKEPTTKGGATVVRLVVGDDPVECSWRDGKWTVNLAADVNGEREAEGKAQEAALAEESVSGELGVYDSERLAPYVGEECAAALAKSWSPYATEHALAGSYDSVVDLTSIRDADGKLTFTIVAPKATPEGYGTDLVNVTYDTSSKAFSFEEA